MDKKAKKKILKHACGKGGPNEKGTPIPNVLGDRFIPARINPAFPGKSRLPNSPIINSMPVPKMPNRMAPRVSPQQTVPALPQKPINVPFNKGYKPGSYKKGYTQYA